MCWFFCVPIQKLIFISINCIFLSVKGDWSGVSRWKSITLLDNLFVWKIVLYCTSQKIGPSSFKNFIYKYVHILSNLSLFYGKQEIRMAQTKSFLPFVVYQFIVDFLVENIHIFILEFCFTDSERLEVQPVSWLVVVRCSAVRDDDWPVTFPWRWRRRLISFHYEWHPSLP